MGVAWRGVGVGLWASWGVMGREGGVSQQGEAGRSARRGFVCVCECEGVCVWNIYFTRDALASCSPVVTSPHGMAWVDGSIPTWLSVSPCAGPCARARTRPG